MTVLKQEIHMQQKMLLIWSLAIGLLIATCVLMFPEMKSQMGDVNEMFSSMGNFTEAFGMDRLDFGTIIGFYSVECGNILGIGGAFFAAIVGVSALMKEERDHTAEFLFSHPVSRKKVITSKLLSVLSIILILNAIVLVLSVVSVAAIGEEIFWKELFLIHLAYLLMQLEIAGICFGISSFLTRGGLGIGIGVACLMYFLNIVANISTSARFLKYVSAFAYTDTADIIESGHLELKYLLPGMVFMIAGVVIAYVRYEKKDLR
ncbi:MAG: ABC transporter permease subunit [Clostridiales bacterium]|nr:ABC transporter permease subunit [Clostridiales bacterium]